MSEKTQTYASGPDRHPSGPPGTVRPLGRSRTDRKVAGVAGGLGAYLDIDPVILRVLFVVLAIFGGSGLLLYLVGWLLIPEEGAEHSEMQRFVDRSGTAALVILGVVVAVLLIASSQALGWWGFGSGAWPLLVVAAIGFAVWYSRRPRPVGPDAVPAPPIPASPTYEPSAYDPAAFAAGSTVPYAATPDAPPPSAPPPPAPTPTPPRPTSPLGLITLSLTALTAGVLVALALADVISLPAVVLFAVLTAIVGLGLVVGSVLGRARWLVVPGILLALVTAAAAAVPTYASGQTGNTVWAPASAASLAGPYSWGAGDVTLDLSAVSPTGRTPVKAGLGAGTLTVILPPTARTQLSASVGIGTLTMPDGSVASGFGRSSQRTLAAPSGPPAGGTLVLDLNVGVGELEVRYAAS
ncbi:MAG TPA: PspC domain-containing protein [Actinomycetes bacterium]